MIITEPPESYPLPWYAPEDFAFQVFASNDEEVAEITDQDAQLTDYIVTAANRYPVLLAENKRLRAQLNEAAPWSCPNCGPNVKVDEDGCCATCGRDAARDEIGGAS